MWSICKKLVLTWSVTWTQHADTFLSELSSSTRTKHSSTCRLNSSQESMRSRYELRPQRDIDVSSVHRVCHFVIFHLNLLFCSLVVIIQNNNKSEFSSGFYSKLQSNLVFQCYSLSSSSSNILTQLCSCRFGRDALQLLLKPAILLPWHLS